MKKIVVLDTSVFIPILAGGDVEGRVYQKIVRDCDSVAVDIAVVSEYRKTLATKFSMERYIISVRLSELRAHKKLIWLTEPSTLPQDIDSEDQHLVGAAKEAHAKYLITSDKRHLWNKRDHIKNTHRIEVLRPEDYLAT